VLDPGLPVDPEVATTLVGLGSLHPADRLAGKRE